MAEKLERIYTVRISKAYNYPRITRARRAVNLLRKFIARHMKAAEVSISNTLNAEVWRNGIEKPPRTVKIKAVKDGEIAMAYLFGEEEANAARQKKKDEKRKASMDKRKGRLKRVKPGAPAEKSSPHSQNAAVKEAAKQPVAQRTQSAPAVAQKTEPVPKAAAPSNRSAAAMPKREHEKKVQQ